ncbi:MAG: bifunctional UDP-N-acetylglucosamine diphosphorylase/glucosamine-1-phosphate N-acetyltransferase GlmU [Rickettsiales bacterium]|nr:bifunctional UDP-N-acetylglucosamine diphosphorylase/glucosamine-1-phosphate N-acetyltransferase GlmU [Rickettsiales bacterium]
MKISALVLAAGAGSRMMSVLPKPLHKIAGYPMIDHVLKTLFGLGINDIRVVIGPNMDNLEKHVLGTNKEIKILVQQDRCGTADAVKVGLDNRYDDLLVLFADTPFIKDATIKKMYELLHEDHKNNAVVVAGFVAKDPAAYGRLVVDNNNILKQIVEFLDCDDTQQKIGLCNSGIMLINATHASELLNEIKNNNAKNEYYLTDLIHIAHAKKLFCKYIVIDESEAVAVNSRMELNQAEKLIQEKLRDRFIHSGVTIVDKSSVFFAIDTVIEQDVIIHPHVVFGPKVKIHSGTEIKSFSHIEGASIGEDNIIGPFARIRTGTETLNNVSIGNFVEIKNSVVKEKTKINHLSYIGDSYMGKKVNIGAGTITCNYDGYNKHITKILDGAFVGSNVSLVAPVSVGKECIIAAGSVITSDVDDHDLAVARVEQRNFANKASYIRKRKNYKKDNQ